MSRIRILHVLSQLNPGGIETWLLQVLRKIDRAKYQFDFALLQDAPGRYASEVIDLGSRIHVLSTSRRPIRLLTRLARVLDEHPYDVVHSHLYHASAFILWRAKSAAIPIRISHSHSTATGDYGDPSPLRRAYMAISRRLLKRCSTLHLAASPEAAEALHGPNWQDLPNLHISECGIDFAPFSATYDASALRREFAIPPDSLVVGSVGRLVRQKNHAFLLEVFARFRRRHPNSCLLLVGDGPLRSELISRAEALGISANVRIVGLRNDVPAILTTVMDAFVFPSFREGLGLAAVEAQAAGLPCILSNGVPPSAVIVRENVVRLDLSLGPEMWAQELQERLAKLRATKELCLSKAQASKFSIETSIDALIQHYSSPGSLV